MLKDYENKKVSIVIKKPVRGFPEGTAIKVRVDKNGIPLERYWRDRFKDSKIDFCLEIVKED